MSQLVCLDCGYDIGDCAGDTLKIDKCPKCNSENLQRKLFVSDKIEIHENVRGKSNRLPGKKRPKREFQAGEEKSSERKKYVKKIRVIDRENDMYYEEVIDPESEETIHRCLEPLTNHFGHGSDKRK